MGIALLLSLLVIAGVAYFVKNSSHITVEQEAAQLEAKAGAEAQQIKDDLEKEVAAVEASVTTPLINVENEVKKIL